MSVEASPKGVKEKHSRVVAEQHDDPGQYKQRISLSVGAGSVGGMHPEHFDGFTPILIKYGQPWYQQLQGDRTRSLTVTLSQGALRQRGRPRQENQHPTASLQGAYPDAL